MTIKTFPKLFKKTKTGALEFWQIEVSRNIIITRYGQAETSNPQFTKDLILKGKNLGKKNETSNIEQAIKEAQSRWEKQIKKGYLEDPDLAIRGETGLGGIFPMLAHKYEDQGHKIKWPCFIQPKLDGQRLIAIYDGQDITLWTRTRKLVTSCPHIEKELLEFGQSYKRPFILDGELYNHEMRNDFNKLMSLAKQQKPDKDHKLLEYHIYDMESPEIYFNRYLWIKNILFNKNWKYVKMVDTIHVEEEKEFDQFYQLFTDQGYEGMMIRNAESPYSNSRSYDLQKYKIFHSEEFKIIAVREGRGKMLGHAIFTCVTKDEKFFDVKMCGEMERLKYLFKNQTEVIGRPLTVKFFNYTPDKIPRFPIGICVRDYE